MKHSILFLFFLMLVATHIGKTQSAISSAGGNGTIGGINISYTLGEAFIATLESSNTRISQGIHQPRYTVTAIKETLSADQIKVSPNLTASFLQVELKDVKLENMEFALFDMMGKCLLISKIDSYNWQTDMSYLPNGYYIFTVSDKANAKSNSFKILKSN